MIGVLWGEGLRVCGLGGDGGEVDVKWEVKTAREEGGGGAGGAWILVGRSRCKRAAWMAVAGRAWFAVAWHPPWLAVEWHPPLLVKLAAKNVTPRWPCGFRVLGG